MSTNTRTDRPALSATGSEPHRRTSQRRHLRGHRRFGYRPDTAHVVKAR
jgi:hypothetical protein